LSGFLLRFRFSRAGCGSFCSFWKLPECKLDGARCWHGGVNRADRGQRAEVDRGTCGCEAAGGRHCCRTFHLGLGITVPRAAAGAPLSSRRRRIFWSYVACSLVRGWGCVHACPLQPQWCSAMVSVSFGGVYCKMNRIKNQYSVSKIDKKNLIRQQTILDAQFAHFWVLLGSVLGKAPNLVWVALLPICLRHMYIVHS
jgi:hypothetical protein